MAALATLIYLTWRIQRNRRTFKKDYRELVFCSQMLRLDITRLLTFYVRVCAFFFRLPVFLGSSRQQIPKCVLDGGGGGEHGLRAITPALRVPSTLSSMRQGRNRIRPLLDLRLLLSNFIFLFLRFFYTELLV